jgi:hypothetical protein
MDRTPRLLNLFDIRIINGMKMQKFQNIMFYVQNAFCLKIVDYPEEDSINRVESLEN